MPQSLAKILVHTVFSTKGRRPFLRDKVLREELHRYLGGILTNLDCQPIIVGGVEDHIHLLCALSRTCEALEMVKELKRGSSLWLKTVDFRSPIEKENCQRPNNSRNTASDGRHTGQRRHGISGAPQIF
jgi:REP element-mobilizing transposase RayT